MSKLHGHSQRRLRGGSEIRPSNSSRTATPAVTARGVAPRDRPAPGCNGKGIQLEHASFARQTAEQWSDSFSMQMLARSALLTARICKRWNVPIRFVDATGLLSGARGITTHWEVTKGPGKGRRLTPTPGKHFPMERYIELVAEATERLG